MGNKITTHATSTSFGSSQESLGTRQRVLEAAGRVFAERGFVNATIRDICSEAGANVAAVNYHFGDKEHLYSEVLAHTLELARKQHPIRLEPGASAEARLRSFVESFLMRILDEGRPAWHGKLMAREMVEPTAALSGVVETAMRPTFALLREIVSDLSGKDRDSDFVKRCAFSIMGQCVMHKHCRPAIKTLYPDESYSREAIGQLAGHITAFSLEGVRGCANGGPA